MTTTERGFISAPEPGGRLSAELGDDMPRGSVEMEQTPTYVYLWNRDTRERSVFSLHLARHKLNEKFTYDHPRKAGDFAWTSEQPSEPPIRGIATCPLHPDRPERAYYDKQGYPICDREALPNEGDALRHLQRKHKGTYELIEKAKEDAFRQEERDSNKSIQERLLALLEGGRIPGSAVGVMPPPLESVSEEDIGEASEKSIWDFEQNDGSSAIEADHAEIPDDYNPTATQVETPSTSEVFFCKKCEKNHRYGSAIAKRHKKHK